MVKISQQNMISEVTLFDLFAFVAASLLFNNIFSRYVNPFVEKYVRDRLEYIFCVVAIAYSDYKFTHKYKNFNEDLTIEQFDSSKNKKYIVTCHGRNDGVPLPNFLNYGKSTTVMTIDISSNINPHITRDLSLPTALNELKCKVDGVIMYHCPCCTKNVMENINLFKTIGSILKPGGSLILVSGAQDSKKCSYTAVDEYFELKHKYDNEKIVESPYYSYKTGCILEYKPIIVNWAPPTKTFNGQE